MKAFKKFIKESASAKLPHCFADIADTREEQEDILEDVWDGSKPLSFAEAQPSGQNEKLIVPLEHWDDTKRTEVTALYLHDHDDHINKFSNSGPKNGPAAIHDYTYSSHDLNKTLIHAYIHNLNPEDPEHFAQAVQLHLGSDVSGRTFQHEHEKIKTLYHGIGELLHSPPKLPMNMRVYSGIGSGFHLTEKIKEGNGLVHFPAYTSTSLRHQKAVNFSSPVLHRKGMSEQMKRYPEIMAIDLPEGSQHGLYLEKHSNIPSEKEFLLNRGTTIRFHHEPRVFHIPYTGNFIVHRGTIES